MQHTDLLSDEEIAHVRFQCPRLQFRCWTIGMDHSILWCRVSVNMLYSAAKDA